MYSKLSLCGGRPVIWMFVSRQWSDGKAFRDASEHDLERGKNTQGLIEIPTQGLRGTLNMQVRVCERTRTYTMAEWESIQSWEVDVCVTLNRGTPSEVVSEG